MELIYDWRNFQTFFYAKNRLTNSDQNHPIYIISEKKTIISVFSEGQDLSDWIGASFDEMNTEFAHRELILFDRKQVDQWMSQAVDMTHYFDQIQYLRKESQPDLVVRSPHKGNEMLAQKHFLLKALQTWWSKFFPSNYGIYISLDGNSASSLLMIVQRGRLGSFHVPDLSTLLPERRRIPSDIVKYISEKHLVPVQGLFLTSNEWAQWSEASNPWPNIAAAIRSDRTKLAPFSWGLAVLIMIRAYFGF